MDEISKTSGALAREVAFLRQRVAQLEHAEAERLQMERQLRQSQAQYQALVETAFAGIGIADPDENFVYANPALGEIMGYEMEELIGLNLSQVAEPQEFARYRTMTQQRRRGVRNSFESVVQRKDGTWINVLLSAAPLTDLDGAYVGSLTVVFDITERRRAEEELARTKKAYTEELEATVRERTAQLKEAQNRLVQSEKLAAVGRLAAGVAHEINNPAGVLLMKLRFLLSVSAEEGLSPKAVDTLGIAVDQVKRIHHITRSLQDFSRPVSGRRQPVDLGQVVAKALELTQHLLDGKAVGVTVDVVPALPRFMGDALELEQVVVNLIRNALDSMGRSGQLRLEVALERETAFVITVEDAGEGIAPEHLDKIFDPFFTTKEVGQGTGLGLAISYGIVKQLGGEIRVDSVVGRGTRMVVWLPLG